MWKKSCIAAILLATVAGSPALAQSALNSTADTGAYGGWDNGPTAGNWNGDSGNTGTQFVGLPQASSSSPMAGGGSAPGNLALKQLGKKSLPPTRLEGFVMNSGKNDAIYGGDGVLLPKYFTFQMSNRIETGMNMPDLTTKHRMNGPSAWDFPQ